MIDIHSHILYGVDDGPANMEQSMELLRLAVREGITEIVSTSHSFHPQYHVPAKTVFDQVALLRKEIHKQEIPLTVHTGQEVRLTENVLQLFEAGEALTIANSNYMLLELPSNSVPKFSRNIVLQLIAKGITPIIAHPERNKAILERPKLLEQLIGDGALTQITAGSLAGHFGKNIQKFSLELVNANLIHTYGSDVHNVTTRPALFDAGLTFLEKNKQLNAVDVLLENNARVIGNQELILYEPQGLTSSKWWNVFTR